MSYTIALSFYNHLSRIFNKVLCYFTEIQVKWSFGHVVVKDATKIAVNGILQMFIALTPAAAFCSGWRRRGSRVQRCCQTILNILQKKYLMHSRFSAFGT